MRPGETRTDYLYQECMVFDQDGSPCSGRTGEGAVWTPASGDIKVEINRGGRTTIVNHASFVHARNGLYRWKMDATEVATAGKATVFIEDLGNVVAAPGIRPQAFTIHIEDIDVNVVSVASDLRARLFREIYSGAVSSPGAGTVTLASGTYTAGSLRGSALYVYSGTGIGQSWAIAWNAGTNGRTLTLVGGDAWRVNTDGTSLVVLFSMPDSFGTLFDRGGVDPTGGRQQLNGMAAAMIGDGSTNVGQPNTATPAVFKGEDGSDVLTASVSATTGAKTVTWVKGSA